MTRCRLPRYGLAAFLIAAPSVASALDETALGAILEETRAELKMPGLRAAVRFPDGRVVRAAVGLADREADLPLDDHVRYRSYGNKRMQFDALLLAFNEIARPLVVARRRAERAQ